jgi:hypothetical protein
MISGTLQINSVRSPFCRSPMPNYRRVLVAGGCWFFTVKSGRQSAPNSRPGPCC